MPARSPWPYSMLHPNSRPLLWLLAFLNAVGPLSTDLYLPAWPTMQAAFGTDIQHMQLTLSSYLAGFALCQLVCGPLSDRFGRRPVLLAGLAVYLGGSLACALAQSVEQLILFRIVQGIGACTGPTLARAIVRDIYEGPAAAKAMGLMAALMTLAPIVAPLIGGMLIAHFDWPSLFNVLVVFVAIASVLALLMLPETWPPERRQQHATTTTTTTTTTTLTTSLHNYMTVFSDRTYRRYTLSSAFLAAGATAFLSGASSVLIGIYGVSPLHFGFYFAVMVLGFTAGSVINARFGDRIGSAHAVPVGIGMGICAALLGLMVQKLTGPQQPIAGPLLFVLCMALYTGGIGLATPQAVGGAMRSFAQIAGTASSLWGFLQMLIAASAGALVGWALQYSDLAISLAMITTAALAWLCWYGLRPHQPH